MQAPASAKKSAAKKPRRPTEAERRSKAPTAGTAERRANGPAPSTGERHQNEGHGRRLTMAFEALEGFPALAESRDRLLSVVSKDHVATADVVSAVESDVALIIAVLRLANRVQDGRGRVDTVVGGVERLTARTVQASGTRRPSASACTRSRPSTLPTAWRPRSATSIATG
jgi:hypothetical protein